jgi:hypothetical protein
MLGASKKIMDNTAGLRAENSLRADQSQSSGTNLNEFRLGFRFFW